LRRKILSEYLVTGRTIIEPTLELREADARFGANFHVEDLP